MSSTRDGCFEIPSVDLALHFARKAIREENDARASVWRWLTRARRQELRGLAADFNLKATVYPIPYAIHEEEPKE